MDKTSLLVKEISKYFRDFLETDFHKRHVPKRSIRNQNPEWMLTGVPLRLFPWANENALKLLISGWKDWLTKIKKGQYAAKIPTNVIELIIEKVRLQKEDTIHLVLTGAISNIKEFRKLYENEYETYLEKSERAIIDEFECRYLSELFALIESALVKIDAGDENTKALMKMEISERIANLPWNEMKDYLRKFFADPENTTEDAFFSLYRHSDVISAVESFFQNYWVKDLSDELSEIHNNGKTLDKAEIYVYFYDISFQRTTYPLFFTPVTVSNKGGEWSIAFESPLYVNKNAIDWIVQEFNSLVGRQWIIKSTDDRITYLSDIENPEAHFWEMLNEICRYFETDRPLPFPSNSGNDIRKAISRLVTISDSCYVNLFDKSDEAIVNDYEELLTLSDDSELSSMFERLVENFIEKNPESVTAEIDSDWDESSTSERLIYKSPVPLNEEQRKALIALSKDKCKNLVIQWPPGTWKSHTITAIVCDYILRWKSVLVVSDKEEALDVVESKISQTLNSVRAGDNFQNPIFRIGKSGSRFNQIVSGTSLSNIRQHYQVVRQKATQIKDAESAIESDMRNQVNEEISRYQSLSAAEIRGMAEIAERIGPIIDVLSPEAVLSEDSPIESYLQFVDCVYAIREWLLDSDITLSATFADSVDELLRHLRSISNLLGTIIERLGHLPNRMTIPEYLENPSEATEILTNIEWSVFATSNVLRNANAVPIWDIMFRERNVFEISLGEYFSYLDIVSEMSCYSEWVFQYGSAISEEWMKYFRPLNWNSLPVIRKYVDEIKSERNPVFGLLFSKRKHELNKELRRNFPSIKENSHKDFETIEKFFDYLEFVESKKSKFPASQSAGKFYALFTDIRWAFERLEHWNLESVKKTALPFAEKFGLLDMPISDVLNWLHVYSAMDGLSNYVSEPVNLSYARESVLTVANRILELEKIMELKDKIRYVTDYIWELDESDIRNVISLQIFDRERGDFEEYATYLRIYQKYSEKMNLSVSDYSLKKNRLEKICAVKMASVMDSRIIDFYDNHANDVQTLKNIIKAWKKFPKELFSGMKKAFPCIIANIRTYSDFIPLEYELFDLVIIDEASQVSIAQALPAVFRGKKTIVLGDKMQFSNVKTSQASSETNNKYRKHLEATFVPMWKWQEAAIQRLRSFDIKKSVLEFLSHIQNHEVLLRKHFRWYKELISFSNKYFYQNSLQVMKIRGKQLSEILEFTVLEDVKEDNNRFRNANPSEANFIIRQIENILEDGKDVSVGVITPHTEQQKLILKTISGHPKKERFFSDLKLKVMTFDTCQGEERDIIFYSMVATQAEDRLSYIFAKELSNAAEEEDKVRLQRLNVGLSRAKEKMHFVLSKPVQEFKKGWMQDALIHYWNLLHEEKELNEVDPNSPMESQVLHWILSSKFYLDNKQNIEIIPQFSVWAYLKQLDSTYRHPNYKVDFLFSYRRDDISIKAIIEYDWFKEHFSDLKNVNSGNFDLHYKEDDIYRQKILESYGYVFLRFNKFNLNPNESPEDTISEKLSEIVTAAEWGRNDKNSLVQEILNEVENYKDGKKKLCSKCGNLKDIEEFYDPVLQSWEWRHCSMCKWKQRTSGYSPKARQESMDLEDIERIIRKSIWDKTKISVCYKGSWKEVRPYYLGADVYMGNSYRCMRWRLSDWSEKIFSVAKITQVVE